MKILTILITLAFINAASARLDETPAQCSARYGKAVGIDKAAKTMGFKKADFMVMVQFWNGLASEIYIQSLEKDDLGQPKEISESQLTALLTANLGDGYEKFQKTKVFSNEYHSKDESKFAKHNVAEHWLILSTRKYAEHKAALKAAEEKKALQDF